jgi:hypothetical protein
MITRKLNGMRSLDKGTDCAKERCITLSAIYLW